MRHDVEVPDTGPARPPQSGSQLPGPAEALPSRTDCLVTDGLHDVREVPDASLSAPAGRDVALLALLSGSTCPPSWAARRRLAVLTPVLAHCVDQMRSLLTAARLVRGATAGTVLRRDGGRHPVPGLDDDPLLQVDSPVLAAVRGRIGEGHVHSTFLWPLGGRHAPGGHTRVTVLTPPDDEAAPLAGVVLLSPATGLHGLTPRELEVLGLLVDGCSNQEIARALVVATRTVAAHVEHVLVKLDAPTRTLAAVRAEREGCYVPATIRPAAPAHGSGRT
jgi:DNA-binding CsgD family transcriptional regulator